LSPSSSSKAERCNHVFYLFERAPCPLSPFIALYADTGIGLLMLLAKLPGAVLPIILLLSFLTPSSFLALLAGNGLLMLLASIPGAVLQPALNKLLPGGRRPVHLYEVRPDLALHKGVLYCSFFFARWQKGCLV